MASIKLAVGASLGAAAVVGGGYLTYDQLLKGNELILLERLNGTELVPKYGEASSFASKYKKYLVDPENSKNKWWWDLSFKRLKEDIKVEDKKSKLNSIFYVANEEKIKSAFGSEATALSQVCWEAIKADAVGWDSQENKEANVWTYCSILSSKPKFISASDHSDNTKFGGDTKHHNKAASAKDNEEDNRMFWELREKEFFGEKGKEGTGHGLSQGSIFATLYGKKDAKEANDTVKKTCKTVYATTKPTDSSSSNVTDEDIKKFCYLVPETTN
ncbi:hypothetical protein [Candidatus Mycoplasma haematohominis]|uniref:Uncharacterized protein n=1 Tax=Candidatus Mycoplasma haematohominis TaxID=1494318 RepID=A0A478FPX5_9MOLU|nr:hypothetical protein [Candidatus Mycoplasma haemohominis]GCE63463.1 hypothetical protein MHSWG343_04600 [Candidatus Mycoplasma haemohominis]